MKYDFHTVRDVSVNTLPYKHAFVGILRQADTISHLKMSRNHVSQFVCDKLAPDACWKTYSDNCNTMVASVNCYLVMSHVPVCCANNGMSITKLDLQGSSQLRCLRFKSHRMLRRVGWY